MPATAKGGQDGKAPKAPSVFRLERERGKPKVAAAGARMSAAFGTTR